MLKYRFTNGSKVFRIPEHRLQRETLRCVCLQRGLFKPDEVLDTILIDDELLFRHTFNLSEYDFASEIDVNILGHF